ncbi:uncharacterized protein F4822DRAFT_150581 [Hypoxylon trugodes]|uniref:uncharacterized protein n=1 Tax=Hypoxylon trugodes TaxID=326681 RepID=UPI00219B2FDE|nr:uncharacterized protein F4822DRAFT_150581 [Hypoxylon trugodes]KAI1382565.1 hypothetical protein F4822DRAFT_150581 [Hypoxylon trugodes]
MLIPSAGIGFSPIYDAIYRKDLEPLFRTPDLNFLGKEIEQTFYDIAILTEEEGKSAFSHHLDSLKKSSFFGNKFSKASCLICLARQFCTVLTCGHGVCERCVRAIGPVYEPCRFEIPRCPLCQAINTRMVFLRPPTAARRTLILDVPISNKILLGYFFKGLAILYWIGFSSFARLL